MGKINSIAMVDRISVLPKDIIDSILTRLPILEAVRTSVLSRSWRYQWHSLSKIDINHDDMFQVSLPEFDNKIVKIIDHILSVHCGSVDKFALNINLETCHDIDRWILYLSRNGIKDLTINKWVGEHYSLPSCLFSCSLTHLKLINCIFKPPHATFRAFGNLTELDFVGVVISDKGLENLLNSCPLLSSLRLVAVNPPPSFTINAPNLVMLHIDTFYSFSQFKHTPLLNSATFGMKIPASSDDADDADCKIVELLGSLPELESLEFYEYAWQRLAVGDVPERLPFVCPIRHLMVCINFEDLQEALAAFCMFRSSPFVQTLDLTFYSKKEEARILADGFWKGALDLGFSFNRLQEVLLTDFTGAKCELKFIKYLLATATALKTMEINFDDDIDAKDLFYVVTKLIRFPRVSPKARLILPAYPNVPA